MAGTYRGIQGKVEVFLPRCSSMSEAHVTELPDPGDCMPMTQALNMEMVAEQMGAVLQKSEGIICVCDEDFCNAQSVSEIEMPIEDKKRCSWCKEVRADFGDNEVNRQMQIHILRKMFPTNPPWCPYASDVTCGAGGRCSTITLTIHGNSTRRSGKLVIIEHLCIDYTELKNLHQYGVSTSTSCHQITNSLLTHVYGDGVFSLFNTVDQLEGTLCFCNKSLCNLPQQDSEDKSSETAATAGKLGVIRYCLLLIITLIIYETPWGR